MSSGTRLDRLIGLLKGQGVSAGTRAIAASQLGEIVKTFPEQLGTLLSRLYVLFREDQWETRIAAGKALCAVIRHVPRWTPGEPVSYLEDDEDYSTWLHFGDFEMVRVLRHGSPLLSSGGKEFEDTGFAGMTQKERIARQRKNLKKKIGLEGLDSTVSDLITDEDLTALPPKRPSTPLASKLPAESDELSRRGELLMKELSEGTLSARERNKKRRELKSLQKKIEKTGQGLVSSPRPEATTTNTFTEQPKNDNVLVMETDFGESRVGSGWPFLDLCLQFCFDLFHPRWQVRHGAALGIRELMAEHGAGMGLIQGFTKEQNRRRHNHWLDDLALRVLSVFALDRYGDYSSDQVVAPVREMCAQTLGALLKHVSAQSVRSAVETLVQMIGEPEWEVRHGCLLGLKYIVAVRKDLIEDLLLLLLPVVAKGLGDKDDDVRAVAADALLPVVGLVSEKAPSSLPAILSTLWECLLELGDLSPSITSVLNLLSEFYSLQNPPPFASLVLPSLEPTADAPTGKVENPLSLLFPRLFPFLKNPLVSVRFAVLRALRVLCLERSDVSMWLIPNCESLLCELFEEIVAERHEGIRMDVSELWTPIVRTISSLDVLCSVSRTHIRSWFNSVVNITDTLVDARTLSASAALGVVCGMWPKVAQAEDIMQPLLTCSEGTVREKIVSALIVSEWANRSGRSGSPGVEEGTGSGKDSWNEFETLSGRFLRILDNFGKEDPCVLATSAGAVIASRVFPAKLNPLIRSVMNSIKNEEHELYQRRAAQSISQLLLLCVGRMPSPTDKILRNLCIFLCSDRTNVPLVNDPPREEFLLAREPVTDEERSAALTRRGALFAMEAISKSVRNDMFVKYPVIRDRMCSFKLGGESQLQIDALEIGIALIPILSPDVQDECLILLKSVAQFIGNSCDALRESSAKWIGTLGMTKTVHVFEFVIDEILPLLSHPTDELLRHGTAQVLFALVELLDLEIVPFIVFLVVPILGRMSDQVVQVRQTLTRTFATLMRLMPLESGTPSPAGMSARFLVKKDEERHFLSQLLDQSKVDKFQVAVPVKEPLRKYQQEGVNWLGFLNKYKLHGILCDDMGLGKTLQALCVVVTDWVQRQERFEKCRVPEDSPLPSLVVCPTTLVAHWYHEILKFFDDIRPLMYIGPPAQRAHLVLKFPRIHVVICSYEVLRNDIDLFSKIQFNYCILDEGHIVRNPKAKITHAVKAVKAHNRLILTGTPIQNNVLELWSLFDFLMPGFLGSEKHFNSIYSKPILASKDPKSSEAAQEAGALALESLHRQVLPFLLRRLKEDVLKDLPPKIIQDYYVNLSPIQTALYEIYSATGLQQEIKQEVGLGEDEPRKRVKADDGKAVRAEPPVVRHIFQALQYLRRLVNHPFLVFQDAATNAPEVLSRNGVTSVDGRELHDLSHAPKLTALRQLLLDCGIGRPQCNEPTDDDDDDDALTKPVGQHRCLVFTQQKSMLDLMEKDLFRSHMPAVTYRRLDGSVDPSRRITIVNEFNSDPTIDLLLLTTKVGGLGLNLTGADTVIFMDHDWNPMADLQSMDRAHRIGQKKVVNVYRFITRGTLEEKIMSLQRFKKNIAETVVNKENASLRTMDTEQLLDLFSLSAPVPEPKARPTTPSEGVGGIGEVTVASKKGKKRKAGALQGMLASLEELWDESQYSEEYDVDKFLTRMDG